MKEKVARIAAAGFALGLIALTFQNCGQFSAIEGALNQSISSIDSSTEPMPNEFGGEDGSPTPKVEIVNLLEQGVPPKRSEVLPTYDGERNPLPVSNLLPVVDAGDDLVLQSQAAGAFKLRGKASDPDGYIVAVSWYYEGQEPPQPLSPNGTSVPSSSLSKPSFPMSAPDKQELSVQSAPAGKHYFRFSAIDNVGAIRSDFVTVEVYGDPAHAPVLSRYPERKEIIRPNDSIVPDLILYQGTPVTYLWEQMSGDPVQFSSTSVLNPTISGFPKPGLYMFRVRATDAAGRATTAGFSLWVREAASANQSLSAVAFPSQEIALPTTSATLLVWVSSVESQPPSITWSQVSGPNNPTETSLAPDRIRISGLIPGRYVYHATATNTSGAKSIAQAIVVVKDPAVTLTPTPTPLNLEGPSLVTAGPDLTITYPETSSVTLTATSLDPSLANDGFTWTFRAGPDFPNQIGNLANKTITYSELTAGTYVFDVRMFGALIQEDQRARVVVTVNGPPTLHATISYISRNIAGSRCTECHNSYHRFGDRLNVVPMDPNMSPLFQKLSNGHAPFQIVSTPEQIDAVKRWIEAGAPK